MSAKIDTYSPSPARAAPGAASSRGASPASAVSTAAAAGSSKPVAAIEQSDRVQLTGGAANLQQFQKAATAAPADDRARVDRIKQSIADGSYAVDPKKIAARLSRLDAELGNA